uniref:Putative cytochrome P450 304a1 n=1 Tax=Bactrocera dorsalis TaxID=27457 RepID=A0A034V211_BACDO
MLTEILLFICAVVCLCLSYRYAVGRPEGFPPGPPRIPFFGSYLFMMLANAKYLHKGVLKFSKWYKSDIVGFHVGPFPVVAVHNVEGVREVLNRKEFDGRAQVYLGEMRTPCKKFWAFSFVKGPSGRNNVASYCVIYATMASVAVSPNWNQSFKRRSPICWISYVRGLSIRMNMNSPK